MWPCSWDISLLLLSALPWSPWLPDPCLTLGISSQSAAAPWLQLSLADAFFLFCSSGSCFCQATGLATLYLISLHHPRSCSFSPRPRHLQRVPNRSSQHGLLLGSLLLGSTRTCLNRTRKSGALGHTFHAHAPTVVPPRTISCTGGRCQAPLRQTRCVTPLVGMHCELVTKVAVEPNFALQKHNLAKLNIAAGSAAYNFAF